MQIMQGYTYLTLCEQNVLLMIDQTICKIQITFQVKIKVLTIRVK